MPSPNSGSRLGEPGLGAYLTAVVLAFGASQSMAAALLTEINPLTILTLAAAFVLAWRASRRFRFLIPALTLIILFVAGSAAYLRPELAKAARAWLEALAANLFAYLSGAAALERRFLRPLWALSSLGFIAFAISRCLAKPNLAAASILAAVPLAYALGGVSTGMPMLAAQCAALWYWYGADESRSSGAALLGNSDLIPMRRGAALRFALIVTALALVAPAPARVEIRWPLGSGGAGSGGPGVDGSDGRSATGRSGRGETFSLAESGFQPNPERLGGPVRPSDQAALLVEGYAPLYLRGAVFDRYTGARWLRSERALAAEGTRFVASAPGRVLRLRIRPLNRAYRNAFAPWQPLSISGPGMERAVFEDDSLIVLPEPPRLGAAYELVASIPDGEAGAEPLSPAERARYLQLPDGVSPRVLGLSAELARSRSQAQAARTMASYLRLSYEYSLDAEAPPEGAEFVDYFLFESGVGYCSYFATALAVLLRAAGIPSRYVEGYYLADLDDEGEGLVRNSDAHAWVEAYLDGMGWTTLEATPPFPAQPYASLARDAAGAGLGVATGSGRPGAGLAERLPALGRAAGLSAAALAFLALFAALPIRVALVAAMRRRGRAALEAASARSRYSAVFLFSLKLLARLGFGARRGETAREYTERQYARLYNKDAPLPELCKAFEAARYGGVDPSGDEEAAMAAFAEQAELMLKARLGLLRWAWLRYVLAYDKELYEGFERP